MARSRMPVRESVSLLDDDPLWYKNAVIYQLHVRSFHDSDGDGIGDFRGLTQKLDYLQGLGVTALWLLPFYPSPLRDDGYDIADYMGVNPSYGTLRDVTRFVAAAHDRGMRVITELVINHTSDQHAWFQRARRAKPGSRWRDYYVWSDTDRRYGEARIIFSDFETSNWTWDPVAGAYFWHRFYRHQPDLNFDNPAVHDEVIKALDFWLSLGVDGLRLDAVPYLYERDGTSCENLPETHAFLRKLRAHVDEHFPNRMLLAEANQWPEDTLQYFGDGDECHMAFNFPVMPRMFMSVQMEDRFPLVDIIRQTPDIPATAQWAVFLRNHDELTLEMVTDEERDYMYRAYAAEPRARINLGIRRRLAPLLQGDRRKLELLNALLFSFPGTPVIYYGDEIGMGDNIFLGDRDGVRTPMQWNADRNAGFSSANPQQLFLPVIIDPQFHHQFVNVQVQENSVSSLLWWMRRMITTRQRHRVFGHGTLSFRNPENPRVLCFTREHEGETVLVVANLSRHAQCAELDLADLAGSVPVEVFGRTRFPAVTEAPYEVTLGPYGWYWLALEPAGADDAAPTPDPSELPVVSVSTTWEDVLGGGRPQARLEAALAATLPGRRWFAAKARTVRRVTVRDAIRVAVPEGGPAFIVLLDVSYADADPDTYVLPVAYRSAAAETAVPDGAGLVRVRGRDDAGVLYDASYDDGFVHKLLALVGARRGLRGRTGMLRGESTRAYRGVRDQLADLPTQVLRGEQSNTSVVCGDAAILKLLRNVPEGVNPDWEIGRFLTERTGFEHVPATLGALELDDEAGGRRTVALLHEFVPSEGDAWNWALMQVDSFLDRVREAAADGGRFETSPAPAPFASTDPEPPPALREAIGPVLHHAALLGRRTAELHLAMTSDPADPAFAPEPFTRLYQRSVYQTVRSRLRHAMSAIVRHRRTFGAEEADLADRVLAVESDLLALLDPLKADRIDGVRIRTHGDYHLGQLLFTGRDFVILDFEGEPMRPLSERRIKRSPLRDVAGMLRSFEYAAFAGLAENVRQYPHVEGSGAAVSLDRAAGDWAGWVGAAFAAEYQAVAGDELLPGDSRGTQALLSALLVDKVSYEVTYEINSRPDWVFLPLRGLLELVRPDVRR